MSGVSTASNRTANVPLENLIQGLENGDRLSSELIVQYNSAADNSLHQCYFKKYYALDEVISVTLIEQLLMLPIFIIAPLYRLPGVTIWEYLLMSIILCYFHYSTLLPLNLWLRYQWVKEQMNCLARDLSFRQLTVGFLIGAGVYYFGLNLLSPQLTVQSFKNPVDIQIVLWNWLAGPSAPPSEELWRLAWYNYLAKYDKYYACVGVSLLFMWSHWSAVPANFLLSLVCIWTYNRYNTIIAPMILHLAYNLFLPVNILISICASALRQLL